MLLKTRRYTLADGVWLPIKAGPVSAALMILRRIISAAIPTLTAVTTASFVDAAIGVLDGRLGMDAVVWPLVGVALVMAYNIIAYKITAFAQTKLTNRLRHYLRPELLSKRAKLEYQCIEDREKWDLIERVTAPKDDKTPEDRIMKSFTNILLLASLIAGFFGVIALTISKAWWAGALILASFGGLILISLKGGKLSYGAQAAVSKEKRRYQYLHDVMTKRETVSERTLFGYSEKLSGEYYKEYEKARRMEFKTSLKWFLRMNAGGAAAGLITAVCVLILLFPTINGQMSVGMFIGLVTALMNMVGSTTWQLTNCADGIAKDVKYMSDFTEFMALPEQEGGEARPAKEAPDFERLQFKNVTFRYPNTEAKILDNLSFTIERGKHYSFVGVNGAGKTTVTKLLLGLYRNYEGSIQINGKELRDISAPELKSLFACVFQDFARYQLTLRENIALGNAHGATEEEIGRAMDKAGVRPLVERVGPDAFLGKTDEQGIDISGGEWQRIAMARAIANPAEIKILDEPTAALDPIAERDIYENFRSISQGHTVIFISHRLGSTRLADIIYVLNAGSVAESGSHEELMDGGGLYAQMFESQRSWYI